MPKSGMDMRLAARVLAAIQRQHLARPRGRVLVALSGGTDSVGLLLLMRELDRRGDLVLAGAAHLNHQLRSSDSDQDESFCRELTARLGVPFVTERIDVAELAKTGKRSLEDAARRARYAFFERAADALGADVVATGHTRDDQAETFLLRILRGAGTRGLRGIHPRRGRVIRPLLDVTRAELSAYVAAAGETFREDASNADVRIPRNRVRHELLPMLRRRFSPRIVEVLAREAELARRDEHFLQQQAIDLARRIVLSENGSEIRLAAAGLYAAHPALSSRIARAVLERFSGGRAVALEHVERLLDVAGRSSDGAVALPGQEAIRIGPEVVLRAGSPGHRPKVNSFVFPLSIPGEVHSGDWQIDAAEVAAAATDRNWSARGAEVAVQAAQVALPLAVRNRRPGDRFRPIGAPGKRKLQDFLVDRKVPRLERDALPLVVDGRDRIVWVPGLAVAEEFKVSDPSRAVILFTVRRLGAFRD